MARQTISCKPSKIKRGLLPKGTVVPISVTIDENGKLVGLTPTGRCPVGCGLLAEPIVSIKKCKFAPYIVNGHAVPYKGDVELVAPQLASKAALGVGFSSVAAVTLTKGRTPVRDE